MTFTDQNGEVRDPATVQPADVAAADTGSVDQCSVHNQLTPCHICDVLP